LTVALSGTVALGKEASGQPLQSAAPVISIDEEMRGWLCFSAPSRAQLMTQTINSHKKVIGSNMAIGLLSGNREFNTARLYILDLL
jgi:hypothetical protein